MAVAGLIWRPPSLAFLKGGDGVFSRDLAAGEAIQHIGPDIGPGGRRAFVNEVETAGDAGQSRLDGRVADPEHLLHLLDRAMAAQEGGDEYLVVTGQSGELRRREGALDGDVLAHQTHTFDDERGAVGE